jgi:hypothetical protein
MFGNQGGKMGNRTNLGKILAIINLSLVTLLILTLPNSGQSGIGIILLLILLNIVLFPVSLVVLFALVNYADNGGSMILYTLGVFIWFGIVGSLVWYYLPGFITRIYKKNI